MSKLTAEDLSWLREHGCDHAYRPNSTLPDKFRYEPPIRILEAQFINSASIGAFTYFVTGRFQDTTIGRYCSIARDVQVGPGSHPLDWLSTHPFQFRNDFRFRVGSSFEGSTEYHNHRVDQQAKASTQAKPVTIGHDVWIGNGALVLPGLTVGNGAVIAARSVVTKNVPAYAIVGGNPARVIRMRFDDLIIERLQALAWWQYATWDMTDFQFHDIHSITSELEDRVSSSLIKPFNPSWVIDPFPKTT